MTPENKIPFSMSPDPWMIIEKVWTPEDNRARESIFSLANEFVGIRGNFEEGISADTLRGSYFNAIYERIANPHIWPRGGFAPHFDFMVNNIQWLGLTPSLAGEKLDMATARVSEYSRQVDMRTGLLTREFLWHTSAGGAVRVCFERFLSLVDRTVGIVRLTLSSVDFDGTLEIGATLDGTVPHEQWGNLQRIVETGRAIDSAAGTAALAVSTITTGLANAAAMALTVNGAELTWQEAECASGKVGLNAAVGVVPGQTVTITKFIGLASILRSVAGECLDDAAGAAQQARVTGWDPMLLAHTNHWDEFWETSDIEIEGDVGAQQALRYSLFQLHMTYDGQDDRCNVAPKGLTGENYAGATFWDTEVYAFPFYVFTSPAAARKLVEYRHRQLPSYRRRAEEMRANGAMLPMITITGEECNPIWELGNHEIHINAALAFVLGLWRKATLDKTLGSGAGAELLAEFARFWISRSVFSHRRNQYVLNTVVGPDEFRPWTDNNAYTNAMAAYALRSAAAALRDLRKTAPENYRHLAANITLSDGEIEQWEAVADTLFQQEPDASLGVIPQDDTFLNSEPMLRHQVSDAERPLHSSWPYDLILRRSLIKQPDTLLAHYLLGSIFWDLDTLRRNFRFYEPRTMHDSSLSPCVHATLAARLGLEEQTYEYVIKSLRLDLDDLNHNTAQGLHITAMCGAWTSIVTGFGGLDWSGDVISLTPFLPGAWRAYSFHLHLGLSLVRIQVAQGGVTLELKDGPAAALELYGQSVRVNADAPLTVPIKETTQDCVRGALFDLDGVLVNTDRFHYQAWKSVADEEGIFFDEEINHRLRGVSRMQSLDIILERASKSYSTEEKEQLAQRKNERFVSLVNTLTPQDMFHGARALLLALREAGWKLALCSASCNALAICTRLEILDLFDAVVDGTSVTHGKPHPEIFISGARKLGLFPGDCVVFEDAQAGIDAAKFAGAAAVGIADENRCLLGADIIVTGLDAISEEALRKL
ncbi:beta-phosphoglucomutase [bacterium]|nr:beta-phosphoglucomutase [candidate division CSSED10-310 bacterium]